MSTSDNEEMGLTTTAYCTLVQACERKGMLRNSLKVMNLMKKRGIAFYEIPWLDAAFKRGLVVFNSIAKNE